MQLGNPLKHPISESLRAINGSVASLKHSLQKAGSCASEERKRDIEKLIAMGDSARATSDTYRQNPVQPFHCKASP